MRAQQQRGEYRIRLFAYGLASLFCCDALASSAPPSLPRGCESVGSSSKTSGGFTTPAAARRFDALSDGKLVRVRLALAQSEDHVGVRIALYSEGAWERADTAVEAWRVERVTTRMTASGELNSKRTPVWIRYELPSGERRCVPIQRVEASADPVIQVFTQTSERSAP
jgi:hypothetical protein